MPRSIGDQHFQRYRELPELKRIIVNHKKFENVYRVYSNSPGEARHIMDGEMIECLMHFKNQIDRDVRVSFVEGICYVAIAIDENLLEPSMKRPGKRK